MLKEKAEYIRSIEMLDADSDADQIAGWNADSDAGQNADYNGGGKCKHAIG